MRGTNPWKDDQFSQELDKLSRSHPHHILLGAECQGCTAYISFFHKLSVCKDRKGRSLVSWLEWRIVNISICLKSSLVAQRLKRLPAMQETWVRSLGWEDPWRRKWQPTPVLLPGESHGWRSPWMEKPGGLQSMGLQRVGHDWATSLTHSLYASKPKGFQENSPYKSSEMKNRNSMSFGPKALLEENLSLE